MMKNSEIAEAAVKYIEEHGWTQGAYRGKDHSVCLLGALREVHPQVKWARLSMYEYPENPIFFDPDEVTATVVFPVLGIDHNSFGPEYWVKRIVYLNDHEFTKQEQALDLLTDAAKYWRDKGE